LSAPTKDQVDLGQADTAHAVVVHQTSPNAIIDLLQAAVDRGLPVEALERLQALHERVSDRAAATEFARDLATFQQKCPPIAKTSTAKVTTKSGAQYHYKYAELDQIARTIAPFLAELGLSYTWDSDLRERMLFCVCTLRHVNGHSISATFTAPVESSAGMSEQQKHASALTYARRQSLIQVLGLTTTEPDTDGANPEPITQQQADDLRAFIEEVGANLTRFLKWAKIQRLEDLPARDYESAINAIRSVAEKRTQKGRGS
jgi:hypothetical protein